MTERAANLAQVRHGGLCDVLPHVRGLDEVAGVRVSIVTGSFLPVVDGVTDSVLRILENLSANRHAALVVAPGADGPVSYAGAPVVRIPAVELPVVSSMPVGVPSRRVLSALRGFGPDVVHLAAPFIVGHRGPGHPRCPLDGVRVTCNAVSMSEVSLFEHAGGQDAIHRFVDTFYSSVLADPVLQPLFGAGKPEHVAHLAAFDSETFGGPDTFTREMGGFPGLIAAHRGLKITEEQRQRFVELYLAAADTVGLPDDEPFRQALREHVEFGSQVAMQNSHAETDDQLHPLREVPKWTWPS